MRYLLTLTLLGSLLAGCSTQRSVSKKDIPTDKPGIADVAPEGRLTETFPSEVPPSLPVMTANPSSIALTPIPGNTPTIATGKPVDSGDLLTFTSAALGMTVNYPPDWSVTEEADGATFTSPAGTTILLRKEIVSPDNNEFKIGNEYCTTRTNDHGQAADICIDNASFTYTAKFSLPKTDGSTQRITLMTKSRATSDAFEVLFNSLRPKS